MIPSYSIDGLYQLHKQSCPDSMLFTRAIREAVRSGELPSVKSGNRRLIRLDVFEKWQGGNDV